MQQRQHAGGRVRAQRRDQRGVHVALLDLDPCVAQRLGDPAAGAQRHVALVGEPAGQDEHASGEGIG